MFNRLKLLCILLIAQGAYSMASIANDTKSTLAVNPSRCVALRQGQTCYQRATLNWNATQPGNYCLYGNVNDAPLTCWKNLDHGQHKIDFQSHEDIHYTLREKSSMLIKAQTVITVAWVYKSKKKPRSSWRLF